MAPAIRIELDKSDWDDPRFERYHLAGTQVRGRVIVSAPEPLETKGVRVVAGWRTEGRGDRDEAMAALKTCHRGTISGQQEFPFELPVPVDGPISFDGHYIQIVWRVVAIIDLSWKKDPKAEEIFYVMPAPAL